MPTDAQRAGILSHVRYEIEQCFIIPKHHEHDWHLQESIFLAILIQPGELEPEMWEGKVGAKDVVRSTVGRLEKGE